MPDSFNYPNFVSVSGLSFVGDAAQAVSLARLTPTVADKVGAMWFARRVNVAGDWTTTFRFRMRFPSGVEFGDEGPGGQGLAFVIQNCSDEDAAIGPGYSGIGYGSYEYQQDHFPFDIISVGGGIQNSLALELDATYNIANIDPDYTPGGVVTPDGNHLAWRGGSGTNSSRHVGDPFGVGAGLVGSGHEFAHVSPLFNDGDIHIATVSYAAATGTLRAYVDGALYLDTHPVDLSTFLSLESGTDAFVGFTASTGPTGYGVQTHDILRWSWNGETPSGSGTLGVFTLPYGVPINNLYG